ncbi:MAG: isoprenylcysteine carboxylmethyltransferase family protein [bacterium]
MNKQKLLLEVFGKVLFAVVGLMVLLFVPKGSFLYWQAWLYCLVLFIPTITLFIYLFFSNPESLERRLKTKEKDADQKLISMLSSLMFLIAFFVPGFDSKFGWSSVSVGVIIVAVIIFLLGYGLYAWVVLTNAYAASVIEVEKDQRIVTNGPYASVRHPMYLAVVMTYGASPVILGSYWALIALLPLPLLIVMRITREERMLLSTFPAYKEYCEKTPYRLIPFLW